MMLYTITAFQFVNDWQIELFLKLLCVLVL